MGVDEGKLQVIDVDVILEKCPITIPLRCIPSSSNCGVYIIHTILYVTFVTAGIRDRSASSSGIYMGFMGVRIRKGKKGLCFIGFSTVQYDTVVIIFDNSVM